MTGTSPDQESSIRRVEYVLVLLLRLCVWLSMFVMALGMATTFFQHPEYLGSAQSLQGLKGNTAIFVHTLPQLFTGLATFDGQSIMALGLLMLIATPVLRVAVSLAEFVREKNGAYIAITAIVLVVLLISFALGKAG